jgi:hypothetical protein
VSLQLIEQVAGSWARAAPAPDDAIARWFRPLVALQLIEVDVRTVGSWSRTATAAAVAGGGRCRALASAAPESWSGGCAGMPR